MHRAASTGGSSPAVHSVLREVRAHTRFVAAQRAHLRAEDTIGLLLEGEEQMVRARHLCVRGVRAV